VTQHHFFECASALFWSAQEGSQVPPQKWHRQSMSSKGKTSKTVVRLSGKGLSNIPMDQYDKDFTFILHGFGHSCARFAADFISPKVSCLHSIDNTISRLDLAIRNSHSVFAEIVELDLGGSILLNDADGSLIISMSIAVENTEQY
jgi:hypothetical protein